MAVSLRVSKMTGSFLKSFAHNRDMTKFGIVAVTLILARESLCGKHLQGHPQPCSKNGPQQSRHPPLYQSNHSKEQLRYQ